MTSLQARLQLGLFLSLVLLAALLVWGGTSAVREIIESFVASRLSHDAVALLGTFGHGQPGQQSPLRARRLTQVFEQPLSGHYYVVRFQGGEMIRSRSLWDQSLEIPEVIPGTKKLLHMPGPRNQRLLVWVGGFQKYGQNLTLAVAEDVSEIEDDISLYQRRLAGGAAGAVLLLLLLQRFVVKRTLKRLDVVRADIRSLEQGKTDKLRETVPEEILPLVREFNRLLGLLGSRLERSRSALGNLAHAIKGPLNLLVQGLDEERLRELPVLRGRLAAQAERIRQLTERELRRARLAGGGTPGQHFDASEELPALIDALEHLYRSKALDIRCIDAPSLTLEADREDLLELLGNLLDNACKWAVRRVFLRLKADDLGIQISVEDDGPGVSEEEISRLTDRGVRIDESVDGHGLGLAIARDITRLYAGKLQFDRSPRLGGLRVQAFLRLRVEKPIS